MAEQKLVVFGVPAPREPPSVAVQSGALDFGLAGGRVARPADWYG